MCQGDYPYLPHEFHSGMKQVVINSNIFIEKRHGLWIKATQKQDLRRFFVLFPLDQLFQQFTLKLGSDHTHRWIPGLADLKIDCMIILRTTWTTWLSWGPLGPLGPWFWSSTIPGPRSAPQGMFTQAPPDEKLMMAVEGSVGYSWAGQLAFQAFHAALETCMAAQIVSGPAPYHTSTIPAPYRPQHTRLHILWEHDTHDLCSKRNLNSLNLW